MNKKQTLKMNYNAVIETIDKETGKVIKRTKQHNQIVDSGLNRVRDLIADASDTGFDNMALGTDNTAVTAGDTALGAEVKRSSVSPTTTDKQIEYQNTFTFNSGESYTIVEAGIFDQPTQSGSTMFNRLTFSGHPVDSNNDLRVTINITLADA